MKFKKQIKVENTDNQKNQEKNEKVEKGKIIENMGGGERKGGETGQGGYRGGDV